MYKKHLTISIDKSKTMIFNKTGKKLRGFKVGDDKLEPVQTFCYLGYEINASGSCSAAVNSLYEKAVKAMQPLLRTISSFNIPLETAIRLFNTYIVPIMLYNVENWGEMTTNNIQKFTANFWSNTIDAKASNLQRKFLKYVMGVSRSSPNLAVMGDTGEIPLMLKGYRLMLQYWHRVTNLPNESLAKKALLENIDLRTNWITTIEKLMNFFNLSGFIGSSNLKWETKKEMHASFVEYWKNSISNNSKLFFYCRYKTDFEFEKYLHLPNFYERKAISKIRCSDHELEIERGRHKNTSREMRYCKYCNGQQIETEEHFLFDCTYYNDIRTRVAFPTSKSTLFSMHEPHGLGEFIMLALAKRRDKELINELLTRLILLCTELTQADM